MHAGENLVLPPILLGVESISSTVDAITQEDLAEQQISAEVKQRIIGVLPNFYVSYIPNAAPLTRKQKFKLALKVTVDPVTFFTTGVTAGIEQWQGDFSGYGQGFSGYAKRYGATYGRPRRVHLLRRRPSSIASASGPALFLQGQRTRRHPRPLRHLHRSHLQRRQRPLAAKLLQRSRQSRRRRHLQPLLPRQRKTRRSGHRRQHPHRCRHRRHRNPLPGVSSQTPHPRCTAMPSHRHP